MRYAVSATAGGLSSRWGLSDGSGSTVQTQAAESAMRLGLREIAAHVTERRSFFDTIRLRLGQKIPDEEFAELRLLNEGRCLWKTVPHGDGYWSTFIRLDQPTAAAVWWLSEYERGHPAKGTPWGPFSIIQVDVALDLVLSHRAVAASATRFLQARILPTGRHREAWTFDPPPNGSESENLKRALRLAKRRGFVLSSPDDEEGPASKEFQVGYLGHGLKRGVRTVVYGSGPTKTTGKESCVHIECRVLGRRALENHRLRTIQQVISLDHRAFWASALKLAEPPAWERVANVVQKRRKKVGRSDPSLGESERSYYAGRVASVLLRSYMDRDGQVNSHDLLMRMRQSRNYVGPLAERLFSKLDAAWLLPESPTNALWPTEPYGDDGLRG